MLDIDEMGFKEIHEHLPDSGRRDERTDDGWCE
jgi:hypothetical protein